VFGSQSVGSVPPDCSPICVRQEGAVAKGFMRKKELNHHARRYLWVIDVKLDFIREGKLLQLRVL
jgi:hypothetical protein